MKIVSIELRYFLRRGLTNSRDEWFQGTHEVLLEAKRTRSASCAAIINLVSGAVFRCSWLLSAIAIFIVSGCTPAPSNSPQTPMLRPTDVELAESVQMFCGDCHMPPDPQSFAKQHWPAEVERGFEFYRQSRRTDLSEPDVEQVTRFYQALAPDRLALPDPDEDLSSSPIQFRQMLIKTPASPMRPCVSHLLATPRGLYVCDMMTGDIGLVTFKSQKAEIEVVAIEEHPAHVELFGSNADSSENQDLLIAELGSFAPSDHALGAVILRSGASGRNVLLDGVGRVAGLAVADLDGDGQQDIAVAEFGWHETGGLHVLLNRSKNDLPVFERKLLDPRHGASHVLAVDLEGDGDDDLVVLHSQEFETVSAYINDGKAVFEHTLLFAGPIPDYGSSCIEVSDIDGDGDVDVVLTNGDSMDSLLLKPTHSVQWLENQGKGKFQHHHVNYQPGVYGAVVGDLDNDGDMDIVACSMTWWDDLPFNTVIWFEQVALRKFVPHSLDLSTSQHACLELGDYDRDGDLDIAVGEFDRLKPQEAWLSIWWNDGLLKHSRATPDHSQINQ